MRAVYWVWRRELAVMLRAPILYVIGGLFLVVQGVAFAALVSALSDARRSAPLGALLEGLLAGTLLTWAMQLVLLTMLGMRTIADERRTGGWELMLTAGVGEVAAVVGVWLAAATAYALLWLPTLSYVGVVAAFRADAGGWDLATLATGYMGAIALGGALLTWVVAASAAMSTTLAAAGLGFGFLVALFFVGELASIAPDFAADHPGVARVAEAGSLRAVLNSFARGEISLASAVVIAGVAATGISLAVALACRGRRRPREVVERALATALIAAIAVLGGVWSARHPHRWDVSASRRNSIDPATRDVVAALPAPGKLTIVAPTLGGLASLYDEVARVARRMAEAGPLTVRIVDPAALSGGIDAAAKLAGLQSKELAEGGGVVAAVGSRRKFVDVFDLATFDRNPAGAPIVGELAIEQSLSGVLAQLSQRAPISVCAATGHGEMSLGVATPSGADWTAIGNRLRGDGIAVVDVASVARLDACAALVIAGPTTPYSPSEALAVQQYVRRGGGLLVAAASRPTSSGSGLAPTGLEALLAAEGLGLPNAIAIDPELAIREIPGAVLIINGYSDHEVNAGFAAARRTLWIAPRVVLAQRGATPLISASPASWGERDLENLPPQKHDDDLAGPVAVAALGATHRVIAIGSVESMTNAALMGGASAGDLWVAQAVEYVAGRSAPPSTIGTRPSGQVRLAMTASERRVIVALVVVGIPLAWLILGGAWLAWRARRHR